MKLISLVLWFIAAIPSSIGIGNTHALQIDIENIKSNKGHLVIAIFDSKENFLEEDIFNKSIAVTGASSMSIDVALPAGEYSVAVFHDTNKNGELDKNMFGWPQEAFGFSKKSMGLIGPPSFRDTKFTIPATSKVKVTLKHL
ncbi:MAG: DUF2141 domain-containing protein [Fulvivirga sp.]